MELVTFENGLRVALHQQTNCLSASICFYVASGNRFETKEEMGVSHFIEHMLFKGTKNRTAEQLAEESDFLGGQLNAYTAKDYTCFYSRVLSEKVEHMLDIMCDMVCNPLFDKKEMNVEKGVVIEEIGMYEDSPEDLCSDLLNELAFKNHTLGYNILGTRETVSKMTPKVLENYMKKTYTPERIVVSVSGKFDENTVLDKIHLFFDRVPNGNSPVEYDCPKISGGFKLLQKETEQTQLSCMFNGISNNDKLKYASSIFSSIFGGAYSSRLNRRIREELGLCYSVYSFSSVYLGTGVFGFSAGLAPNNQQKFLKEAFEILNDAKKNITEQEIYRTKEQIKANLVMSYESSSGLATLFGKQLLLETECIDIEEMLQRVDCVTLADVIDAANKMTDPQNIALCVVGQPLKQEEYECGIIGSVKS